MVNFAVVAGLVMAYLLPSPTLSTPIFDMAEGSWGGVGTPVRLTLREWKENDLYSSKGNTWLASSSPPGKCTVEFYRPSHLTEDALLQQASQAV